MAGLRRPEEDIGVARAPRWSGRALLALFVVLLLVIALLDRLGLQSVSTAQAVVAVALVLFAAMALLSPARRAADYYAADREISPRRGGIAAAGTVVGLLAMAVAAGMFATSGEILNATAGLLFGCLVAGTFLVPRLRRFGGNTAGDFVAARFGFGASLAVAAVAFGSSFLLLMASFSTAGPLLDGFAGLTERQGLFVVAAVIAVAVVPGGMRSLTTSQGLQYAIAVVACVAAITFMAVQNGTLPVPNPATPGEAWTRADAPAGLAALIGLALPILLTASQTAALPQMLAHGPSARSGRAAMAAFAWAIVFSAILFVGAIVFARAALDNAGALTDATSGELMLPGGEPLEALPPILAGLATAGVLAMLLAAGQAALFAATSALSHDVWDEFLARRGAVGRRVFAARALAVGLAAAAAWLANRTNPDAGALIAWGLALAAAGGFAPLLLGLWWSRCNTIGALAGTISGAGIVVGSFFIDPGGSVAANAGAIGVVGSFAAAILCSLATAAPPAHQAGLVRSLKRGALRNAPGASHFQAVRSPVVG